MPKALSNSLTSRCNNWKRRNTDVYFQIPAGQGAGVKIAVNTES
jgi:hypothetical protein